MPRTACIITGFAITSLLLLVGCTSDEESQPLSGPQPEVPAAPHSHAHAHGPMGGHLIELKGGNDEEYHAELVFDPKTRKTTVYILDAAAKSLHPIEAKEIELHLHGETDAELTLTASPEESDGEGLSSRFELAGEALPESIKKEEDFEGHLHVHIGGKDYSGDVEHDHDHDHGHKH